MNLDTSWDSRLGFADLALKAFGFLLQAGFRVVRRDSTHVRFESDAVFIKLYHGRSSYHVGLELGRLDRQEIYSLHEVLASVGPEHVNKARCHATTAEVLEQCLTAIAQVLDASCRRLLAGEAIAFEALREAAEPALDETRRRRLAYLRAQPRRRP